MHISSIGTSQSNKIEVIESFSEIKILICINFDSKIHSWEMLERTLSSIKENAKDLDLKEDINVVIIIDSKKNSKNIET